jgi:hypothetical protein
MALTEPSESVPREEHEECEKQGGAYAHREGGQVHLPQLIGGGGGLCGHVHAPGTLLSLPHLWAEQSRATHTREALRVPLPSRTLPAVRACDGKPAHRRWARRHSCLQSPRASCPAPGSPVVPPIVAPAGIAAARAARRVRAHLPAAGGETRGGKKSRLRAPRTKEGGVCVARTCTATRGGYASAAPLATRCCGGGEWACGGRGSCGGVADVTLWLLAGCCMAAAGANEPRMQSKS